MAGNWIKMSTDLRTHPKVVRIASALKADRLRVVGGLHAAWCLFDAHSEDGFLDGYTIDALNDLVGWPGFAEAMVLVGWINVDESGLHLPRFDSHNGQSAKRRAQETERKRIVRSEEDVSACDADKKRSREDKIREEKKEKEKGQEIKRRAFALPEDVSLAVFSDWQALRKAKKAPITATAIDGIRREAQKAGITLESALAMACERGWTGFKAEWLVDRGGGANSVNKQSSLEARNKAVADSFRGSV